MRYFSLLLFTLLGIYTASAQTQTPLVNYGSVWKYLDNGSSQTGWPGTSFNDAAWKSGAAELGYGDGDEKTIVSFGTNTRKKFLTTYFRRNFTITDTLSFGRYQLSIRRDDGAVVYVNGIEVFRSNMPAGTVNANTRASSEPADDGKTAIVTNLPTNAFRNGNNVVAVEIHQSSPTGDDISFDLQLIAFERINTAPSVNAGTDRSLTLPEDSVQLTATGTDAEFNITSYTWSKISGPDAVIVSPASSTTKVRGLTAGTYVFRVRATDLLGLFAEDDVQVTVAAPVNQLPVVNAGNDTTITLPADSVKLIATASDPDGTIASYLWSRISGGSVTISDPSSFSPMFRGLEAGTYVFQVLVTDNRGGTATDQVMVTVLARPNDPPTLTVTENQVIVLPQDSVLLSASASDTDGQIASYAWTKLSGNGGIIRTPDAAATMVAGLTEGSYVFGIKVKDNDGDSAEASINVRVDLAPNIDPVVFAGNDTTIMLPANSLKLYSIAADSDGAIVTYRWSQIEGSQATLLNPDSDSTTVSSLSEGTFVFRVMVTDNRGGTASDDITITVLPKPNTPPSLTVSPDQVIVLPQDSVWLSASAIDTDGVISSYEWSKLSGAGGSIRTPDSSATLISGLTEGNYAFRVKVKDDDGDSAEAIINVRVDLPPNVLPVVFAGKDTVIVLPVNSVRLSAKATDDDGLIVSYNWAKITGPTAEILNPGSDTTTVTGLTNGLYKFEITVTDNRGGVARDTVAVDVWLPNVIPSVELGAEKYVFLPTNTLNIPAVATDSDGTIVSYSWTQTSGTATTLGGITTSTLSISGLALGTYSFRVRVIDNRGDSAVDNVAVNVLQGKTTSAYLLPVNQNMVINLNGVKGKDAWRLFDKDTLTRIDANSVDESRLALPYYSYVILDSTYDINQVRYFVKNSDQTSGPTIRFMNENRQYIGDSLQLSTKGKYLQWTNFNISYPAIRFIEVTAYTRAQLSDGVMELRINAWGLNPAASIYPTTGAGTVNDLGIYAHGVNIIGDRLNRRTETGDTILPKVTKAARFYWEGQTFDIYPQTYINPLENAPLNLGRYGFNHSGNLLDQFKRWDIKPMMTKSGGSIKYLGADTASWNNSWLGGTHAQNKRYLEPGANPELPASWKGLAEQYHKLIALYGGNTAAVLPPASVLNGNTTAGQGNMDIFEWDNEPNRSWQTEYYHSPRAYYRAMKAVYDRGKQADPNARIYAGALPGIDTVYWKAVYFIHYLENGLAPFPADGFNFNNYLNNGGGQQGTGRFGVSPEQFDLRSTLTTLKGFFDRHFPNKPVQWTEFGYATDNDSDYDVDPIGTKTDKMVQADWTLRVKAVAQTVRFLPRLYYYAYFEDFTTPFNSMAMIRDTFNTQGVYLYSKVQPVAYALAQEIFVENIYPFFSTIVANGDSTGVWVTRKDHPTDVNKRLYKLWRGSSKGDTTRYVLNVTGMVSAKIYTLKYDSFIPDTLVRTVTDTLQLNVTEGMTWVEATIRPKKNPRQAAITAFAEQGTEKFNIYPVPVRRGEMLTINTGSNSVRELVVYNVSGQKMKHLKVAGVAYLKTEDLSPGVYFLQDLRTPGNTRRFVVIR